MVRTKKYLVNKRKISHHVYGYLFTAPLLIGLAIFFFVPLAYAIYLSFTNYSFANIDTYTFIGFDNYIRAFKDEWFLASLLNGLINMIGVPIGVILALILSNFLVNHKRGSVLFRTIYYIPTICGVVAISFIWMWLYAPMYGFLQEMFSWFGVKDMVFLNEDNFMASMIVMGVWSGLGTSVLLFFAQLKNISKSLYEAAMIDGCNSFQRFIHVTVPGTSPIAFYILITGFNGALQDFARFQVMRGTMTKWSVMPVWYIYSFASSEANYQMGYASALGIILAAIIMAIYFLNQAVSKLWVHYE